MPETPDTPESDQESSPAAEEFAGFGGGELTQEAMDALLAAADLSVETGETGSFPEIDSAAEAPQTSAGSVDLPSFDSAPSSWGEPALKIVDGQHGAESAGMERVRDIPLEVTVELGRTRLLIRDILELSAGSIIELDKIAGEPVDLYANSLLVARGEVIVIDDNFGVRITEIITAADRHHSEEDHAAA